MEGLCVKEPAAPQIGSFPNMTQAMKDDPDCVIHVFRSGGGLRVVRLGKPCGKLKGYGEHPYIETAMAHAEENCRLGHEPYELQYGKRYDHYLTGSSDPSSPLDRWTVRGRSWDIHTSVGEGFVFETSFSEPVPVPQEVKDRALAGERVEWREPRGILYEVTRYSGNPNAWCMSVLDNPKKISPYDHELSVSFSADTLEELLAKVQVELQTIMERAE